MKGLHMRALRGGEGGVLRLRDITVVEGGLSFSEALETRPLRGSGPWVKVAPINSLLPSASANPAHTIKSEVDVFVTNLLSSVRKRTSNIPPPSPGNARLAILFSGGVDCTFLAYLAHLCLPIDEPIELINVAFERLLPTHQSSMHREHQKQQQDGYDVPDRLSGREALAELRIVCTARDWLFVEINIPYSECQEHRQMVLDLMYPCSTEMDLSLAFPLYFSSRGIGEVAGERYVVRSRVYLSGLGADEQLGGYARHRNAYDTEGWRGLVREVQLDINRLPSRNLSRDDRMTSSHSREARYPYLDLSFVDYLSSLPIDTKLNPVLGGGVGDKALLRLASAQVGLVETARRVKRAMQFGTRSSKMGSLGGVKGRKAGEQIIV